MTKNDRHIVVIGTSAGGNDALAKFLKQLPADLNIAVFIVMHITRKPIGKLLIDRLQSQTNYTCKIPKDGEAIKTGHIYLAPPDIHMLLKKNKIIHGHGPTENRWRPSIDVLFRSAAVSHTSKVIGIILTGLLDDGLSGMLAIKKCGGICIVQDTAEAQYPDLPQNIIDHVEVDHLLPISQMGKIIRKITNHKNGQQKSVEIPKEIKLEAEIAENAYAEIDKVKILSGGKHSVFSCPACGGGLWEINEGDETRFRCHVGHSYTGKTLLSELQDSSEASIWVAIRIMEERRNLLLKMSDNGKDKTLSYTKTNYKRRAEELKEHIDRLKKILFDSRDSEFSLNEV